MTRVVLIATCFFFHTCAESLFSVELDSILPSVAANTDVYKRGEFSVISAVVDHNMGTNWIIPSAFRDGPALFNKRNNSQSDSCHLRFLAVALQDHDTQFRGTGIGYVTPNRNGMEENRVDCYFVTNRKTDFPQTVSIAIVCPVQQGHALGYLCSHLTQKETELSLSILYQPKTEEHASGPPLFPAFPPREVRQLTSLVTVRARNDRLGLDPADAQSLRHARYVDQLERHSVCTVQVFRNKLTSARLFLFVAYYLRMGWTVIVYDRYGLHKDVIADFKDNVQLNYFPFTVFQSIFPDRYNVALSKQNASDELKFYFAKEAHGQSNLVIAKNELHNQDSDKQKTYDFCRSEFSHVSSMLFVDADELIYCPKAIRSIAEQRSYQKQFMDRNIRGKYDEIHLPRNTYFFRLPRNVGHIAEVRYKNVEDEDDELDGGGAGGDKDAASIEIAEKSLVVKRREVGNETITEILSPYIFVNGTDLVSRCMIKGYEQRSVASMLGCWTRQFRHSFYPKHADLKAACPFHWNHFSCFTAAKYHEFKENRFMCKCNVNELYRKSFKKIFNGCHVMHLNRMSAIYKGDDIKTVQDRSAINFSPSLRAYPMWLNFEKQEG